MYHLYPILVKFVHITTLHLGVPFMGLQQIETPWTFHIALAYFCDISSLLCNTVCVQVNLLCATYCTLPSMAMSDIMSTSSVSAFGKLVYYLCSFSGIQCSVQSLIKYMLLLWLLLLLSWRLCWLPCSCMHNTVLRSYLSGML